MSYRLQFTEKMIGAFTFGARDYHAGYAAGKVSGARVMFRLTIATDDVDAFIADPRHVATAQGYVDSDVLGGRRPVEGGVFNLFVDEGPRARHMLYRLYFSDATGRPLTLTGFKDVRPGPLIKVWPETSTLYIRVLAGHVPDIDGGEAVTEGVVGSGILRIRPLDFAWQLTTFRVHGPDRSGELQAFDRFGRLFVGELWQVFDPFRRMLGARRATESGRG
jgi:cholesterol oxidase